MIMQDRTKKWKTTGSGRELSHQMEERLLKLINFKLEFVVEVCAFSVRSRVLERYLM